MPSVGNQYPAGVDTNATWVNIGPAGTNVTWDFSQAAMHRIDTTFTVSPASTPYGSNFASSTFALTLNNDDYLFFQNTTNALIGTGIGGDLLDDGNNLDLQFNPTFDLYQFPTQYGNTFGGTYVAQEVVSGSAVGQPAVHQVRLTLTSVYEDTIDAWGTVITPVGQYSALRQHRVENTHIDIDIKLFSFSSWSDADDIYETTDSYTWLNNDVNGILVSLGRDENDNITSISYSMIPPAPVADFSYVNVSGGVYDFTDESLNSPTTWSWDFGDGSPVVTQQNPTHVFTQNDTVYTCLTVTNASGSDTYCDSVRISTIGANNPPVARKDTGNTTSPNDVDIDVTANDLEPDNDNITVTGVGSATNGTTTLNLDGTINYQPDASFAGTDSFTYTICDDGVPSLCDTGWVYVAVAPNPTVASFSSEISDCEFMVTNTSTNVSGLASFKYVTVGETDTSNFLGDTLLIPLSGAATEEFYVCISVFDAANNLYRSCNTAIYTAPTECLSGIATTNTLQVALYPNPTDGQFVMATELDAIGKELRIYDLLGSSVKTFKLEQVKQTIDATELTPGLYIYSVGNTTGKLMIE